MSKANDLIKKSLRFWRRDFLLVVVCRLEAIAQAYLRVVAGREAVYIVRPVIVPDFSKIVDIKYKPGIVNRWGKSNPVSFLGAAYHRSKQGIGNGEETIREGTGAIRTPPVFIY